MTDASDGETLDEENWEEISGDLLDQVIAEAKLDELTKVEDKNSGILIQNMPGKTWGIQTFRFMNMYVNLLHNVHLPLFRPSLWK